MVTKSARAATPPKSSATKVGNSLLIFIMLVVVSLVDSEIWVAIRIESSRSAPWSASLGHVTAKGQMCDDSVNTRGAKIRSQPPIQKLFLRYGSQESLFRSSARFEKFGYQDSTDSSP